MTKKKPKGHNIGGTSKQKRRKENKDQLYWCNMNKQKKDNLLIKNRKLNAIINELKKYKKHIKKIHPKK